MSWVDLQDVNQKSWVCGWCGNQVASAKGYRSETESRDRNYRIARNVYDLIYICPNCNKPTHFPSPKSYNQTPGAILGNDIGHLPHQINTLYCEARKCIAANAYTSSVLLSRKLMMHIAVEQGAPEGSTFLSYVEYLSDNGFVPPNGKGWVDHIRTKGNEANHEIRIMEPDEASQLISFLEMLLKFIYEFPALIPTDSPE